MTTFVWAGISNNWTYWRGWNPWGIPESGDETIIQSGTVTAGGWALNGLAIVFEPTSTATIDELVLVNSTIGANSTITGFGGGLDAGYLLLTGTDSSAGKIQMHSINLNISVGQAGAAAAFTNSGTIDAGGAIDHNGTISITIASGSSFTNIGSITSEGPGNAAGAAVVINGAGTFTNSGQVSTDGGAIDLTVQGTWTNNGSIFSASPQGAASTTPGAINIGFASASSTLINNKSISVEEGAKGSIGAGKIINNGEISTGGTLTVNAAIQQSASGFLAAGPNGGDLIIESSVTGGTIAIDSGKLEFGGPSRPGFIGPASAHSFAAAVQLGGKYETLDSIQFDGVTSLSEVLKGNQLLVYGSTSAHTPSGLIADITLTGGAYAASSFHVQGNEINYIHPLTT